MTLPEDTQELPQRPRRRKRGAWPIVVSVLAVLVIVPVLLIGGFLLHLGHDFNSESQKIDDALPSASEDSSRPSEDGSYNVLLMGSDSRQGEADQNDVGGQRADTIMLLHVPQDGGQAYVISIMRDTWVNIPGHGEAKINAALDEGGVPLEVRTIEDLLKTRIDHVAQVDFQGFRDLTNAVGGVTVDVPQTFTAQDGTHFTQGSQKLDGDEALAFVRERHSFADGDYQRVKDQRLYLRGLLKTIESPSTLTNPKKLDRMVEDFSPYISVDDGLTAKELATIALKMGPHGFDNLTMFTLPNAGTGWSDDGQSIVVPDDAAIADLSQAINDGTMSDYVKTVDTDQ